jgi:ADP-heptose:LPS heptosyltransferase
MIRVAHSGKHGDLVYALPVMRALARLADEPIHLTTSGMCMGLVPLLWEQPYIEEVVCDETHAYELKDGISSHWDFYDKGDGINLSLQPAYYELDAPISWTLAAARIAGVEGQLTDADFVALPSLRNHRSWYRLVDVSVEGKLVEKPRIAIVAPEVESLTPAPAGMWVNVATRLRDQGYKVLVLGKHVSFLMPAGITDLRGVTTVASMARLIAEASVFVGAHSFPWHLARHSGTPAVCLQGWREGLRRCVPIDTEPSRCPWVEPDDWEAAVQWALQEGVYDGSCTG